MKQSHETSAQAKKIEEVARAVGTDPRWLDALINFETAGTYSTTIKNPNSSARGLIQLTDAAARDLGYADSLAAVSAHQAFDSQMEHIVKPYLVNRMQSFNKGKPLDSRKSLYMSVFYPAYMDEPVTREFPEHVQRANTYTVGGKTVTIKTPLDYIEFVNRRIKEEALRFPKTQAAILIMAALGVAALLLMRKQRT